MRLSVLLLLLSVAVTQARRVPKFRPIKIPFLRGPAKSPKPVSSASKGTIQVHRKLEEPRTNPAKSFSPLNFNALRTMWSLPVAADKMTNNEKKWTDSYPLRPPSNSQDNINLGEIGMNLVKSFSPLNFTALRTMWSDGTDRAISGRDIPPIAADKKPNNGTKWTDQYNFESLESKKIAELQRYLRNTEMNPAKPFSPLNFKALLRILNDGTDRDISGREIPPIAADKKPNNGTKWTDISRLKPLESKENIQVHRNLRNTGKNPVKPFSPLNYTALLTIMSDGTDRDISGREIPPIAADKKPNNGA